MFKFITDRPFWVNLLAAAALGILLIVGILQLLGYITKHGEYLTVPAVKGHSTNEAIQFLESKGFDIVIQDSIFTDTLPRGIVIKQLPDANATVKINRTVYLTVNCYVPPMVVMPALEGKNLSYALDLLKKNHLLLGDTTFKPDFMKGSVLEQSYMGSRIATGAKLPWGSKVSLVIASGLQDEQIMVPDFIGKTFAEAKAELDSTGIIIGAIIAKDAITDTASAFIYKQSPERFDADKNAIYIHPGQLMDLYISQKMLILEDSSAIQKNN